MSSSPPRKSSRPRRCPETPPGQPAIISGSNESNATKSSAARGDWPVELLPHLVDRFIDRSPGINIVALPDGHSDHPSIVRGSARRGRRTCQSMAIRRPRALRVVVAVHPPSTGDARVPIRGDRLGPGRSAAPGEQRLTLLPSGPDVVHEPPLRGTRSSTSITPPASAGAGLGREFSPAGADCRYRAPLVPRLARPRNDTARNGAGSVSWNPRRT